MWIRHKVKNWGGGPERVRIISERAGMIVEIDCTTAVSPVFSNTVTTSKTEEKKDLTSNIIINAATLNLTGIIGNKDPHDLSQDMAFSAGTSAIFDKLYSNSGKLGFLVSEAFSDNNSANRAAEICQNLIRFQSERHLLTISTRCFVFNNMVIKSFNPAQNKENGKNLSFNMDLSEVRWINKSTTKTRLIKAKNDKEKKAAVRSSKKEEMGIQPVKPPEPGISSAAMTLFKKLGG